MVSGKSRPGYVTKNLRGDYGSEIWLSERFVLFMGIEP